MDRRVTPPGRGKPSGRHQDGCTKKRCVGEASGPSWTARVANEDHPRPSSVASICFLALICARKRTSSPRPGTDDKRLYCRLKPAKTDARHCLSHILPRRAWALSFAEPSQSPLECLDAYLDSEIPWS
ncbi:hypothetical protein GQ53DRAFT_263097 [Thozetella sp. PMI_491]|nr:hypothetical protein GQ53DRAFT_263097 [Thozetella sp. PMI_491]